MNKLITIILKTDSIFVFGTRQKNLLNLHVLNSIDFLSKFYPLPALLIYEHVVAVHDYVGRAVFVGLVQTDFAEQREQIVYVFTFIECNSSLRKQTAVHFKNMVFVVYVYIYSVVALVYWIRQIIYDCEIKLNFFIFEFVILNNFHWVIIVNFSFVYCINLLILIRF